MRIRIRIQQGKNEQNKEISSFEVLDPDLLFTGICTDLGPPDNKKPLISTVL
jgi:hypothetical protein